ncbi:conjugal transfer protein TraH [Pelomonas sp. HMWF004]|nr:conjugal transfer protein TraH [Pelomonas sp. HMWF004]
MFKRKQTAIAGVALMLGLSFASFSARAGIMGDLNTMFMSNTTAPTTVQTKDRTGFFGGSFVMRTPIKSVNLVTFDPPRLDAGCGGVDLYLGSFTFINSQQLVALFRQVAANAVGLAFKAAINLISPDLGQLISEFQTLLQKMNNLAKNSCNLAHMLVDPAASALSSAVGGDAMTNNVANSVISDWTKGLEAFNNDPTSWINQAAHANPLAGNQHVKALTASTAAATLGTVGLGNPDGSLDDASNPNSLNNRVLISLLGFSISGVSCSVDNEAGTPNTTSTTAGTGMGQVTCNGPNTVTLQSLIDGGGAGSATPDSQMVLWTCMNPNGSGSSGVNTDAQVCTKMQRTPYAYQGIRGYVNKMLFGAPDYLAGGQMTSTSIVGMYAQGGSVTLSPAQVQFLQQSGSPIVALFGKISDNRTRMEIANRLSDDITACIAAKVGGSLYQAANNIKLVANYSVSDEAKTHIEALRKDTLDQNSACMKRNGLLNTLEGVNRSISLQSK